MKLSNKTYDVLVYIARIVIPAISTLYASLVAIWNLPYGYEVVATLSAVDLFLNALLKISSAKYNKEQSTQFKGEE